MKRKNRMVLFVVTAGLSGVSCSSAPKVTEVVVVVDTDMPRTELDHVDFTVVEPGDDSGDAGPQQQHSMSFSSDGQPLALGLVHRSGPLGPMAVTAQGRAAADGAVVAERQAVFHFIPNEVRVVRLDLLQVCTGKTCPTGQTCLADGQCGDVTVEDNEMTPWTGTIPGYAPTGPDGGQPDGSDTGVDSDVSLPDSEVGPECLENEECGNGQDDNCNGLMDEFLSSGRDDNNCGFCSRACTGECISRECSENRIALDAGENHTCTVLADGDVLCWGSNDSGQLGGGSASEGTFEVTRAVLGDLAQSVAAGGSHTCALLDNGEVWCWGSNNSRQLGSFRTDSIPRRVVIDDAEAVVTGKAHSCAVVREKSTVYCWGSNSFGQTGHGGITPDRVEKRGEKGDVSDVRAIAAGENHTCTVGNDGKVRCWGSNGAGQLGREAGNPWFDDESVEIGGLLASSITAGARHTCAILASGGLVCWGSNSEGQLGDGTTDSRHEAEPVTHFGSSPVEWATAGYYHTCAAGSDGAARCWGNNDTMQLGQSGVANATTAELLPLDPQPVWVRLAGGGGHTCGIALGQPRNHHRCWGRNDQGQANPRSSGSPQWPPSVLDVP